MSARWSATAAWPCRSSSGSALWARASLPRVGPRRRPPLTQLKGPHADSGDDMPMIDDRGRVLGRVNLIDAAFVLLLVAAVPVAYGAYLLFRDPTPRLTNVLPNQFPQGPNLQT